MKKTISDGWHGNVYVESGMILRAVKKDHNGSPVPASVYRTNSGGGFDNVCPCKYETAMRGFRKGNYAII